MSVLRPMQKRASDTEKRARAWAAAVFAMYGRSCWIHVRHDPRSKVAAIDPAHVIKRSRMGEAIAYGSKDGPVEPRLGRPLCRDCHNRQESDLEFEYRFSYDDVLEATSLHNSWAKKKLPLPEREDYP